MTKLLAFTLLLALPGMSRAADSHKPVKVFILAGQSNMEGKAKVSLLEYQAEWGPFRVLFGGRQKEP